MDRRHFLGQAALITAATSVSGAIQGLALAKPTNAASTPPALPQVDPSDRSSNRDPLAIQRATLVVEGRDAGGDTAEQLRRLRAGGINCSVVHRPGIEALGASYRFLEEHGDTIVPATAVREIRQIHGQGKIARVYHFQGPEALERETDWRSALRAYYQLGLRISAVALNVAGTFGGGCLDSHVGLTRAGRRLVEELHKLRIVLDVAGHTGDQTSFDAIEMSGGVPVICSHTNVRALVDNPRNISDRLIEAIAKTGGVIGLTAVSDFHVRTRNDVDRRRMSQVALERHLDQYDYLKKLVGVNHIALGVDNIEERAPTYQGGVRFPEMYSDPGSFFYIKGFETISELPNVTAGLIQRGWSTAEIWKVLGENWLRVYQQVWGA